MSRIPKTEAGKLVQNSQVGKTKIVYVPYYSYPYEGGGILGVFETKAAISESEYPSGPWGIWEFELNVSDQLSI